MSFLHDAVCHGPTSFHKHRPEIAEPQKSSSYGGLLAPLAQLVKSPAASLTHLLRSTPPIVEKHGRVLKDSANRREMLYARMKEATTYDDWRAAASELDALEGNDVWKQTKDSLEYDVRLVEARLKELDEARISLDLNRMLFLVRTSLTRGLGGMGHLRLYRHSHVGTKVLLERYIESAKETLKTLIQLCDKQRDGLYKKHVLDELLLARQAFGRSALLLSGGGTFGMNHNGVVKTLWEQKLLPRIVCGASAGSIVCSVLATRTDAEISDVIEEFCYGDMNVFGEAGEDEPLLKRAARFLKHGAIFDIAHLMRVMKRLLGDLTFQEAYNRTRRILNISVSSAGMHELPRLLNYITAPNVIIWSAVVASCSVPVFFSPVSLLAKDPKTGDEVPWNPSPQHWIDGSVDSDLPMTRLAEMFNVNHFIVSQVNPHVVPFLAKGDDRIMTTEEADGATATSPHAAGPGWLHTMASLAKSEALHRMHVMTELGICPTYFSKARSVLSQKYSGDITIVPDIPYAHFPKVLANPTTEYILEAMLTGEQATWPKLSRIQNHCAIELALDDAVQQLRAGIVFSPSQVNLRLDTLSTDIGHRSNHEQRGRANGGDYARQRPTRSTEDDGSISPPPQRTWCYLEVPARPKRSNLHPQQPGAPLLAYKVSSPALKVAATDLLSSADDDYADLNPFSEDTDGAESYSSDSSPPSPLPELWPSTRQLFPSASQPVTPFFTSRLAQAASSAGAPLPSPIAHSENLAGLMMTPMESKRAPLAPSTPELQYKQLFHAPAVKETSTAAGAAAVGRDHGSISNLSERAQMQSNTTNHSRRASGQTAFTGDATMDGIDVDNDGARKKRPRSRQGTGAPLVLDISGTRGMMLRRKRSLNSGIGIKGIALGPATRSGPQ